MKNNGLKNAKAITLIAMVVTIIVLLILAGVSIAVLTGENGLLNRATTAKQTHEEKTEEEKLKLGVLALSTEYRSQTTHAADEDKFSKFINKEANKTKLANELGVATSAIEIDTAKDILTYRNKKYTLDSIGGITDYVPKKLAVGDEITIGDEHFYVIKKEGTTVTLFSKYNLKKPPTDANETDILQQYPGNKETTKMPFSQDVYWLKEDTLKDTNIDLNSWDTTTNVTIPETETVNNNAILRARQYANNLGIDGAIGRLLTYEEANPELETCLFGTEESDALRTILWGTYNELNGKVGGDLGDGYLNYWLSSAIKPSGPPAVQWAVHGSGSLTGEYYVNHHDVVNIYGVRPVIEVPESAIQ